MRKILKCLLSTLLVCSILSISSLAFENGEWITVTNYDQRQDYYIDRGEMCEYIVKLYEYVTWQKAEPIENPFWDLDINSYPYALDAYSFGFANGTDATTFSPQNQVSRGALAQMLFRVAKKINPGLDLGNVENIAFPDFVPAWNIDALRFAYSRGIIELQNGYINADAFVTVEEALSMVDSAMRKTPSYEVLYPTLNIKRAYLTFDDVPSQNVYSILDTLKQNSAKATFFVTGKAAPELLQRMKAEGHIVGNHTLTHNYGKIYASSANFWNDFWEEEAYLESQLGYKPTLMRFPGGSNNTVSFNYGGKGLMRALTKQAKDYGYTYFDWNVSSGDAASTNVSKEAIIGNVLNGSKNLTTAVVLMHDSAGKGSTAAALPQIIEGLKNMGFAFYPLDEKSFCPQFIK